MCASAMDALVSSALLQVAAEGTSGCPLPTLWNGLLHPASAAGLRLDQSLKQTIWKVLLSTPCLAFQLPGSGASSSPAQLSIQALEDAEKLGVHIIGSEQLRDSYLGVHDLKHGDSRLSAEQRMILERLGKARTDGVTQYQLAKEFGMSGKKLFYIVRNLESRSLVVRQSSIFRDGRPVATNLIHLKCFEKDVKLHSQQRFEIQKAGTVVSEDENKNCYSINMEEPSPMLHATTDIRVNDDLPALEAICKRIEEADGKVLIISDLKVNLGYRFARGHRAWRRLLSRLTAAGLVEVFDAKVEQKVLSCIRLVRPFDPKAFSVGADESGTDQYPKGLKRGQITEQVAELSINRQIYDIIEQGGSDGVTVTEIFTRLGLNNRRNYFRLTDMISKHGLRLEAENYKRSTQYRVRVPENVSSRNEHEVSRRHQELSGIADGHIEKKEGVRVPKAPHEMLQDARYDDSRRTTTIAETDQLAEHGIPMDGLELVAFRDGEKQEAVNGRRDSMLDPVDIIPATGQVSVSSESLPVAFSRSTQRLMALSSAHTQREVWIMERLERERFILRAELHKWLEDMECRRDTLLDRKTVIRNLQKLQHEGRCKCMLVSIPGVTNLRNRTADVVLLPSVEVDANLLSQIHERQRAFDLRIRVQGSIQSRLSRMDRVIPVLTGLKRMPQTECQIVDKGGTLRDNGFVSARMVRCRMLHQYLWDYISGLTDSNADMHSSDDTTIIDHGREESGQDIFSLLVAVQAMPLELFLQVIGSTKHIKGLAERCRRGMRLSDLPVREAEMLLDTNASGRLSWLVDILRRLKLLRIVMIPAPVDDNTSKAPHAGVAYALEAKPYIDEPAPERTSSVAHVLNFGPSARHDFHLFKKESIEEYWKTLEYFFCGADPSIARRVFPGSTVPELFGPRSWTSLRVMTMDQRTQLQKRIGMDDNRRLPYKECVQIAQELNLSLDQVLRVSYEKNHKVRLQESHNSTTGSSDLSHIHNPVEPRIAKSYLTKKRSSSSRGISASLSLKTTKLQRHSEQMVSHHQLNSPREEALGSTEECAKDIEKLVEGDEHISNTEAGLITQISVIRKLRPLRKRKYPWTDASDRALIACYTKQRAILGARYNRVDWHTMPGLPAPPETCRRRIAFLKMIPALRKLLMALCNVLASRYTKHLRSEGSTGIDIYGTRFRSQIVENSTENPLTAKRSSMTAYQCWDDFEDPSLVAAVDDIIRCKNVSRASLVKKMVGSSHGVFRKVTPAGQALPERVSQMVPSTVSQQCSSILKNVGIARARPNRVRVRRQLQRPTLLKDVSSTELVQKSVGAAMAVELVKLVLLNFSVESEVSQALVDALRRCKESDIFSAFRFLKDQGMVAVGQDSGAFVLSPKFYENSAASPFCPATSDESLGFEAWLREMKAHLEQDWVTLKPERQWGELFHLFALISMRQLSIAPFMPDKGIGEKDQDDVSRKRKRDISTDAEEACPVKTKTGSSIEECGFGQRRERGFPGIEVKIHCMTIPLEGLLSRDSVESTHDLSTDDLLASSQNFEETATATSSSVLCDKVLIEPSSPMNEDASEETEAFSQPLQDLFKKLESSVFNVVYDCISKAGGEGLRVEDIAELIGADGAAKTEVGEVYSEALQSSGLVRKVMAFDHVRLISCTHSEHLFLHFPKSGASDVEKKSIHTESYNLFTGDKHSQLCNQFQHTNEGEGLENIVEDSSSGAKIDTVIPGDQSLGGAVTVQMCIVPYLLSPSGKGHCRTSNENDAVDLVPVLPWLKGDGKENTVLRKALNRRIMGIVMLKPGILEESIIEQVDVLNPTSCQRILQLLVLDGHLLVRTQMEHDYVLPPLLLQAIMADNYAQRKIICRRHYYANPLSSSLL